MDRRTMLKSSAGLAVSLGLNAIPDLANSWEKPKNKLPAWKGFNLLDFFNPNPPHRIKTNKDRLQWMADWGFDFVRIPMAYPYYIKFDRSRPIQADEILNFDEEKVEEVVSLVSEANKRGLHVSLNLHRAPGFCVNAGFQEPYNLWTDEAARDAFYAHWTYWAKLFRKKTSKQMSFDLLNEPCLRTDMNDQFSNRTAVPKELYRELIEKASIAIRKENKQHLIIADGNNIGSQVIDNIADLEIGQSCRGYAPGLVSHYKAPWVFKDPENVPPVSWPLKEGDKILNKAWLEKQFDPWIKLAEQGGGVHCGECGAWRETPHDVALAWMEDMFSVLTSNHIGYALWEFEGDFGLINSRRKDVEYEDWYGQKLDRKMLDMLMRFNRA